jgi:hypothetical protein
VSDALFADALSLRQLGGGPQHGSARCPCLNLTPPGRAGLASNCLRVGLAAAFGRGGAFSVGSRGLDLVLPVWIEHTTSPLPRECSTTELRQQTPGGP